MKNRLQIATLIFLTGACMSLLDAQVVINEFLASNNSVNADMIDHGDFSDWIELYNPHPYEVDISGYFITDNLDIPLKWQFPDGTIIPPESYLLVWTDGFNDVPGAVHIRPYWPFDEFTTQGYHTNFKLSALSEEIGLFRATDRDTKILINKFSEWKYLDDGSDQDTLWRTTFYDDSRWNIGYGELGYGDGGERTVIGYGPDPLNKYATTYFRKTFNADFGNDCPNLLIRMKMDDGAIIYINGEEVIRPNMPEGYIPFNNYSFGSVWGEDELIYFEWIVPGNDLVAGSNLIAIEMHQNVPDGADLSFDLELTGIGYSTISLVDSVTFGPQKEDISYGRLPNQPDEWSLFSEPTPLQPNITSPTLDFRSAGQVAFSLEAGFYDQPQTVLLYVDSPSATIKYTTDGSTPNSRSQEYIQPIHVAQTTVLKARAIESGRAPGRTVTSTYFIDEDDFTLPVVSFSSDSFSLWDEEKGIYRNDFKQREVPVSLEYFSSQGDLEFNIDAGFRIGGLNIWRFAQKPLTIYIRGKYGKDALNYQLFRDKSAGIFNRFVFRNGGDDHPLCMLRDAMSWSILRGQTGCGVQAYAPCILFLNGAYWGIYNIRERFDEQFFAANFGADPFAIDHLEITKTEVGNLQLTISGDPTDYNALENYVRYWNPENEADYDSVCAMMDIDSFIDFLAVEIFSANTSWPHNREWWRSEVTNVRWSWLITDLDRGYDFNRVSYRIAAYLNDGYPLFRRLLQAAGFRNRFVQRLSAHLNCTFHPDRISSILDSLSDRVYPEMPHHIERWAAEGGIQSMQSWLTNMENIKRFSRVRADTVWQNVDSLLSFNGTAELSVQFNHSDCGRLYIEDIPILSLENPGRYFKGIPVTITAYPSSGFRFIGWNGISNSNTVELVLSGDSTIFGSFIQSESHQLPSVFVTDTTLTAVHSPYVSNGDITILSGVILTIQEGVEIRMPQNASIYVNGGLVVQGREDHPVIFTPDRETGTTQWGAICFVTCTEESVLSHIRVNGATHGNHPVHLKAAISALYGDIRIENAILENVDFPIFCQYSDVILRNSTITTDVTCDFINVKYGYGLVENSVFYGNNSRDTDAIDFDRVENGIIRGNRIYDFIGYNCDGVDIGEESQNIHVHDNIFYNCLDKGISIGQSSTALIERNVFTGCNQAIAVKDGSSAVINQNTFYNNFQSVACYEKIQGTGGSTAEVVNCILSASTNSPFYIDSLSAIQVSFSLSDTDELPGEHNLNEDPAFVNRELLNLSLLSHSPCIDAGDPSHPRDPDGSICDMGAYYRFDPNDFPIDHSNFEGVIVLNEINYSSLNSFNPEDWIELYNPGEEDVDLTGWTMKDNDNLHQFTISDTTVLKSGGYLVMCSKLELFRAVYPTVEGVIGGFEFGLDADGDAVRLYDRNAIPVISLRFDNQPPWTDGADGTGRTLELIHPYSDYQLPENWYPSLTKTGTPGFRNSVYSNLTEQPPTEYRLWQNYPNPFNSITTITFDLVEAQNVNLSVVDVQGRLITTLINGRMKPGYHGCRLDTDGFTSGIYFYRLECDAFNGTGKMIVLR